MLEVGRQSSIVSLGLVKLSQVLVAHRLEVLHLGAVLEAIVLVIGDGNLDPPLGRLVVALFEVGDSLTVDSI